MSEIPNAHEKTMGLISLQFQWGQLNLREQCMIIQEVTGSLSQKWSEIDAATLLAYLVAKGHRNLKAWAAQIEEG